MREDDVKKEVPFGHFRRFLSRMWCGKRHLYALVLSVPLVLTSRLLRPIMRIRFGRLRVDRIGHLAHEPELYLSRKEIGLYPAGCVDLFGIPPDPVANKQLLRMWRRELRIVPFADEALWLSQRLPGHELHHIPWPCRDDNGSDPDNALTRTNPHLTFTAEELVRGEKGLRHLGIPNGEPYVCFACRDASYLANRFDDDYSYHDYRDATIDRYVLAASKLEELGYFAIRMGAVVAKALPPTSDRIIDYATNGQSDFMDMYLFATAAFLLLSNSGPCSLGWAMRRPMALANVAPLDILNPIGSGCIYIPKLYWAIDERRFLTFAEIRHSGADRFLRSHQFQRLGIELIENSPEEIRSVAVEMHHRTCGAWEPDADALDLQKRFWHLAGIDDLAKVSTWVGQEFLFSHRALLNSA